MVSDMMTAEQLKRSILQLAMQGKLVEQRPEEGTGEELYREIQSEKKRLIKEGKVKKKSLPDIIDSDTPFDIPDSWRWVRISEISTVINGDRGKNYPSKSTLSHKGIPFISALNLDGSTVVEDVSLLCVSQEQYDRLGSGKLEKGDIVVCIRGSLGKHGRYPFEKGAIASSLVICRQFIKNEITALFIMSFLDAPLFFEQIKQYDNGTAQPNLAAKSLERFFIPLPPLAEQKRIVAKIEELMPFVEQYAAASTKLNTLNASFPEMMKKSILQEAMQGKLVPQDPNDEPASLLLKKIAEEKKRLIREGKIKKQKPLPEITEDEIPFEIPESWEWVRLAEISTVITGGTPSKTHPEYYGGEFPFYKPADIQSYKYICNASEDLSMEGMKKARFIPKGSIAVNCIGNIGKSAIMPKDGTTNQQINSICYYPFPDYIYWFCQATVFISQIRNKASMTTIPIVNKSKMEEILVPIPPLNEQKRIVKKVEDIMPIIDRLRY